MTTPAKARLVGLLSGLLLDGEKLPGPSEEVIVGFCCAGGHLQGVPRIPVPEEVAGVVEHETKNPEGAPLQDVGQFMGQQPFGQLNPPFHQNRVPPRLRLGPGGDEPGYNVNVYRNRWRSRQYGLPSWAGFTGKSTPRPGRFSPSGAPRFPGGSAGACSGRERPQSGPGGRRRCPA
jgi:hypothetical protein